MEEKAEAVMLLGMAVGACKEAGIPNEQIVAVTAQTAEILDRYIF